jgi:hypothetical protein
VQGSERSIEHIYLDLSRAGILKLCRGSHFLQG